MSEWISVHDETPDSGVLVVVSGGVARYYRETGLWFSFTGCDGVLIAWDVTHWMPLPPPPEKD